MFKSRKKKLKTKIENINDFLNYGKFLSKQKCQRTDGLTDWLTDSQSSLSSFYNIDCFTAIYCELNLFFSLPLWVTFFLKSLHVVPLRLKKMLLFWSILKGETHSTNLPWKGKFRLAHQHGYQVPHAWIWCHLGQVHTDTWRSCPSIVDRHTPCNYDNLVLYSQVTVCCAVYTVHINRALHFTTSWVQSVPDCHRELMHAYE